MVVHKRNQKSLFWNNMFAIVNELFCAASLYIFGIH